MGIKSKSTENEQMETLNKPKSNEFTRNPLLTLTGGPNRSEN